MASPSDDFVLSRASAEDIAEITAMEYRAFANLPSVKTTFLGCESEADLPKLVARCQKDMQNDPNDVWIKVVDKSTGKIVAASNWKVFINKDDPAWDEKPCDWMDQERTDKAKSTLTRMNKIRHEQMPGGSYLCESSYQICRYASRLYCIEAIPRFSWLADTVSQTCTCV